MYGTISTSKALSPPGSMELEIKRKKEKKSAMPRLRILDTVPPFPIMFL
jgi:hypothetical protein